MTTPRMRVSARHEAGHCVIAHRLGMRLSSVWIVTTATRGLGGRTQLDATWLLTTTPDRRLLHLHWLAGDAAEGRVGLHILKVRDEVGEDAARELWAEAKAMVEADARAIDGLAKTILERPNGIYGQEIHDLIEAAA